MRSSGSGRSIHTIFRGRRSGIEHRGEQNRTRHETGAFLSHARALEQAQQAGLPLHILEDDALLSQHVRPVIEDAIAGGLFERFDILFTDIFVNPQLGMLKGLKTAMDSVALLAATPIATTQICRCWTLRGKISPA